MKCKCRKCPREYLRDQSTADFRGYCSRSCQYQKAVALGFGRARYERARDVQGIYEAFKFSMYYVLLRHGMIGSVEV